VRTARSNERRDDDLVHGLLTISGGTWYFGYDAASEEILITWVPSEATSLPLDSAAARVLVRVWNIDIAKLRSDMDAGGSQPVLEKEIDLSKLSDMGIFREKMSLKLDQYLVFRFEGTGPALGEQEREVRFLAPSLCTDMG